MPANRIVFAAAITGILAALSTPVLAQDTDGKYFNSPYHAWFDAQENQHGMSCCLEADAHDYIGDYTIRGDGSVDLTVNGLAVKIEPWKVILSPEPPGMNKALLWYAGNTPGPYTTYYCFHPAALT